MVLCLEDKPSPEEKELIQALWVVSALPQLQRWANSAQLSAFLCVLGWLQSAFSFKPWHVLCPKRLMLFELFWSAQNSKTTTSELVCKIHWCVLPVLHWPCNTDQAEWNSGLALWCCCNHGFGETRTFGVVCSHKCRALFLHLWWMMLQLWGTFRREEYTPCVYPHSNTGSLSLHLSANNLILQKLHVLADCPYVCLFNSPQKEFSTRRGAPGCFWDHNTLLNTTPDGRPHRKVWLIERCL